MKDQRTDTVALPLSVLRSLLEKQTEKLFLISFKNDAESMLFSYRLLKIFALLLGKAKAFEACVLTVKIAEWCLWYL